ncbi:hypothetical protein [Xanthomonas campestris]|uniref:hypothetical protein n=1 Tax=Xanthomonas campestris TaxID=339 RepID=UPI00137AED4A|nr:hypothetical protein [Xanthomonas campestris]
MAWVFCAADSGLDVLAGLGFFQGALFLLALFLAAVLLLVAFLADTFLVALFRTLLCCVARLLVAFFAVPLRGVARFFAAVRAPLFDVAALAPAFATLFLADDFVLAAFFVAAPVCLLSASCRRACSRSAHRCPASPPHSSQAM